MHYFKRYLKPHFFILKAFCSTLNSRIGGLENSIFDVTNRAFRANAEECQGGKWKENQVRIRNHKNPEFKENSERMVQRWNGLCSQSNWESTYQEKMERKKIKV